MMNSRERLIATLTGQKVDRPAVSFYEIGGLIMDHNDPDPFNVYNDPSWKSLLEIAENYTDIIRMRSAVRANSHEAWSTVDNNKSVKNDFFTINVTQDNQHRWVKTELIVAQRTMRSISRRDLDVDTIWITEHLLKNKTDLEAYLQLPDDIFVETIDISPLIQEEQRLADRGIVMVDTEDPLCVAANLFSIEDFTILAMTQNQLFHKLLEKCARYIYARTEKVARKFPGRLWRIYGPEYACSPFLPPRLFNEYVVRYTGPMVQMIKKYGGFARIHAHGRINDVMDMIIQMGADAIDPIEPATQGDVKLRDIRKKYGENLVLFGNIEISEIELLEKDDFRRLVAQALADGTHGNGRGFVLMPSASPFGRKISKKTLENYQIMLEMVQNF